MDGHNWLKLLRSSISHLKWHDTVGSNIWYYTVAFKVLLNRPHSKLGQHCAVRQLLLVCTGFNGKPVSLCPISPKIGLVLFQSKGIIWPITLYYHSNLHICKVKIFKVLKLLKLLNISSITAQFKLWKNMSMNLVCMEQRILSGYYYLFFL